MKKLILAAAVVATLAGCVVAPVPAYSPYDYPVYESSYYWDSAYGAYYFNGPYGRHYMDRGWAYRERGVPRGRANFSGSVGIGVRIH